MSPPSRPFLKIGFCPNKDIGMAISRDCYNNNNNNIILAPLPAQIRTYPLKSSPVQIQASFTIYIYIIGLVICIDCTLPTLK